MAAMKSSREDKTSKPKNRRSIRLPDDAYRAGELFLLTLCTSNQSPLFSSEEYAATACDAFKITEQKIGAIIWCGIVMPDHVHMLVSAAPGKSPLDCGACYKRLVTIAMRKHGYAQAVWQRRIYDRGIRTEWNNDITKVVHYVMDNPVRKELVSDWTKWPYTYLNEEIQNTM